ncbi:MAG TPA: hypothetical protein VK250_04410 [Nitrososphaeraceae archaeon]|nr:hypothetical protein [Nitrososphaeraceae archaeon]
MSHNIYIKCVKKDKKGHVHSVITNDHDISPKRHETDIEFTIEEIRMKLQNSTIDNVVNIFTDRLGRIIRLKVDTITYGRWTLVDQEDSKFHLDLLPTCSR